jgi:hypothetical protein
MSVLSWRERVDKLSNPFPVAFPLTTFQLKPITTGGGSPNLEELLKLDPVTVVR